MNDKDLVWEEISQEHIVQDEWIDFRKSWRLMRTGSIS